MAPFFLIASFDTDDLEGSHSPISTRFRISSLLEHQRVVLTDAFRRYPERFVHGSPEPPSMPEAVWINPPAEKTTHQDALGATISTPDDLQHPPSLSSYELSAGLAVPAGSEVRH